MSCQSTQDRLFLDQVADLLHFWLAEVDESDCGQVAQSLLARPLCPVILNELECAG